MLPLINLKTILILMGHANNESGLIEVGQSTVKQHTLVSTASSWVLLLVMTLTQDTAKVATGMPQPITPLSAAWHAA